MVPSTTGWRTRPSEALRAGVSVVADATFQEAPFRRAIEAVAGGYAFHGVWLQAPATLRAERVRSRFGDASEATAQIARSQVEPDDLGDRWLRLDAGAPASQLVHEALAHLAHVGGERPG